MKKTIEELKLDENTLIVHLGTIYKSEHLEELRKMYEKQSGLRVVILDGFVKNYTVIVRKGYSMITKEESE